MRMTVTLFARARDLAGTESLEVDLPQHAKVADLRTALAERTPDLRPLVPHLLIAVGTNYAEDNAPIDPNAEIACFPPVSGG